MINVKTAQTKELVSFYNEHSEKPVKKFVNRATAELRVTGILNELKKLDKAPKTSGIPTWVEVSTELKELDTTTAKRSVGVARSWMVPEVAETRKQRSAVEVDGTRYGSVAKAFAALGLDLKNVIKFRAELKAAGKIKTDDGVWKVIPLNY